MSSSSRVPHTVRRRLLALLLCLAASALTACGGGGPGLPTESPSYSYAPSTISPPPGDDAGEATPTTPAPSSSAGVTLTRAGVLERNRLYRLGAMRAAGCAAESDAPLDGVPGVRAFYGAVLACLNRAWGAELRGNGVAFRPARLVVHSGEERSACGAFDYSFYCPSEDTVYMYAPEMVQPWRQYEGDDYSHQITHLAAAHTIAHEYGHHVQNLTDIFAAVGDVTGTPDEQRLELQASCLGNVFLSAQRGAYPISSSLFSRQDLWRFITRVPSHGTVGDQELWTERGYAGARPGACNTFSAPAREVR